MDLIVTGALALLAIVVTIIIGSKRVRQWFRLEEPDPYLAAGVEGEALDKDPVVGPIVKAEEALGSSMVWVLPHEAPAKANDGFEYLRTDRKKIVYRSKTLAHGEEMVLMVQRREQK